MSLFIEFEQRQADKLHSRFVRCDELCTEFGVDLDGLITSENFQKTLFAIFRHGDSFFLLPYEAGLSLDSQALEVGRALQIPASGQSTVHSPWFKAQFLLCSTLSESVASFLGSKDRARNPETRESARLLNQYSFLPQAKLSYKLGSYSRHMYLFLEHRLLVGSALKADFRLPYQGIAPRHFEINQLGKELEIKSLVEPILINQELSMKRRFISAPEEQSILVQIPPLGLRLEIDFL